MGSCLLARRPHRLHGFPPVQRRTPPLPLFPVPQIQVIGAQNRLILFGLYPQRNREEQLKAEVLVSLKESVSSEWKHERLLDGVFEMIDAFPGRLKLHISSLGAKANTDCVCEQGFSFPLCLVSFFVFKRGVICYSLAAWSISKGILRRCETSRAVSTRTSLDSVH